MVGNQWYILPSKSMFLSILVEFLIASTDLLELKACYGSEYNLITLGQTYFLSTYFIRSTTTTQLLYTHSVWSTIYYHLNFNLIISRVLRKSVALGYHCILTLIGEVKVKMCF